MERVVSRGELRETRMVRGCGAWEVRMKVRVGGVGLEKW